MSTTSSEAARLVTFLADLTQNNHKEWFEAHRPEYDRLRQEFVAMLGDVIVDCAMSFAPELAAVEPKKCLFRIFRDTRFSSDKSPYKTNFGALMPVATPGQVQAGYYVHLDAGGRLVAGACVHPLPPAELTRVREYIAEHHAELTAIVSAAASARHLDLDGERQKSVPRGFPANHSAAEFLKHKSFKLVAVEPVAQVSGDMTAYLVDILRHSQPFADFMKRSLA